MRTNLMCPECAQASGGIGTWFVETIREDGLYTGKCPNGHDLLIATQTLRHEMLFEIALNAIVDGYYREAISSFTASMERFFEFAVRVICRSQGLASPTVEEAWKKIASQSERQLGSYIFLYLTAFGRVPQLLSSRMTELRNEVVHKGSLPERQDVLRFGSAVYEVVQEGVKQLRETHLEAVNSVLADHVSQIAQHMGNRYPRTFQVTPTALNVIADISSGYQPFDELRKQRGIGLVR